MKKKALLLMSALVISVSMMGCNKMSNKETGKAANEKIEMNVGTWKTAQTIQPFIYDKFKDDKDKLEVKSFTNPGDMKTALLSGDLEQFQVGQGKNKDYLNKY